MKLSPNVDKELTIVVGGKTYERWPIKTHVITDKDDIVDVVKSYAVEHLQKGDMLFMSERVVAITQGRSIPIADIVPSKLAKFLVRFVYKSPYGIGLGSPWTMQLALDEVGMFRILFASLVAAVTKPFGIRGMFYRIAGRKIAAIDGPCDYTLPPYNKNATLAPKFPHKVAKSIQKEIGNEIVIIDANDLGVDILGVSNNQANKEELAAIFKDNPLGQSSEQTPLCVVRLQM
ncbi:coenzyme F420-0:L-glutamate ligase [Patescibacteria group bacterium]|nr:coenzyme F420-0:L-glutamate ligase [Patescibacteria group bacterium]MBU1721920.1 coenzyme F420-0:L-glutamate ligase [Patescibacteria group bacterium]MBU1901213.1 coenzyme F420-0:L-glutamate ligase [Patescibacteria group bacterium]